MLKTNLVNQIHDLIIKKIIYSELEMGEKIIISSIAKEFNVSSTPVRETLNSLIKEGLVEHIPNVGNFVYKLNEKDIEEILYIRELLERISLKYAILQDNKKIFLKLLTNFKELENKKDLMIIRERFYQLDKALHLSIIKSTSNRRLFGMYKSVFDILFVFILKIYHLDKFYPIYFNHCTKLLEAIISKDYIPAKKFLDLHFNQTRIDLKRYFNSK